MADESESRGTLAGGTGRADPDTGDRPRDDEDMARRRNLVGRNMAVLLGSQVVTWCLAIILTVAEPRLLGPDGVGQLRLGMSVWAIALIFAELGTSTLLTLEFARNERRAFEMLRPVLVLRMIAMVGATIGVATFILIAGYDGETSLTVALVGIGLAIMMFAGAARDALYGLQSMGTTARAEIASKFLLVTTVVGVLLLGAGPQIVAIVMIFPAVLSLILLWVPLRRRRSSALARPDDVEAVSDHDGDDDPDREPEAGWSMKQVLRAASPYLLGTAILVVYGSLDVIVISLVATTDEIGWYAAANALFATLLFVPTTMMTSLFPAIAQLHKERPEALPDLLARSFRSLLLVAVPIGVGTVVVARPVTLLLLGDDFEEAGVVLSLFGLVLVIMFQTILLGGFAYAIDRHRLFNLLMITATLLTIPLDVVLVKWAHEAFDNGAIGGPIAYIVTETFVLAVAIRTLAPGLLDRTVLVRIAKVALAGTALYFAAAATRDQFLAVPIMVGAVTYGLALLVLRIPDSEEVDMGRALLRKVTGQRSRSDDDAGGDQT